MANDEKKQEREELHRAIWSIADELRGAVDGWDFKNYVLGTMFYRYISENLTMYINEGEIAAGNLSFDYAQMDDAEVEEAREGLVEEKGFFILPSELFCNVRKRASQDENLNETLEKVFNNIEESAKGSQSEGSFAGLFDDFDVNSNKLGSTVAKRNERLVKLLDGIAEMNLGSVKNHDIDAFGDAYEYLMTMYASNAGRSGGEFFTPAGVSELLTRLGTIGKKTINKVYDPACGSGSLLLKAEKILGKDAVTTGFFGQEINITTYNLCRINMFLHDVGFDKFSIECDDTLTNPQHWDDEPFELIVSNPPYSIKWEGDDNPLLINDPRFSPAGVLAPKAKADFAFIMHSISWLAPNGVAAIVCYTGIMYRGGAERKIRQYLVDNNYVDAIIQLPRNLFFGTEIPTCIMVLRKGKVDNKTFFMDASEECIKVTNNNKLTEENINRIVDIYANKKVVQYISYLADYDEIAGNSFDLSVPVYVESMSNSENVNIDEINTGIERSMESQAELRSRLNQLIMSYDLDKDNAFESLVTSQGANKVEYAPLWSVTIWDKKFNAVDKRKQPKVMNYPYLLAKDLFALQVDEGDVFLLSTGEQTGWTTEELAGDNMREGEVVTIPWGKSRAVVDCLKYYKGKFVTADNRIMTSADTNRLSNKYLYYWTVSMGDKIDSFYRGAGIKHPDMAKVLDLEIPIPHISVQNKIVEILDELIAIEKELCKELSIEMDIRQKQYKFYSEKLLTFTRE